MIDMIGSCPLRQFWHQHGSWRRRFMKKPERSEICKIVSVFYRATRMHSVDYAVQDVCLSVCVSHAGIVPIWLHVSSKFFSPSSSPTILAFPYQTEWQYSNGDSLTGASNARVYEKNHDFRPISRFILEQMQDRAIVTIEGEQETALKLSNGTSLNDLE